MTFVASLLLSTLPQVFPGGDIKLPPRPAAADQAQAAVVRPVSEMVGASGLLPPGCWTARVYK